MGITLAVIIIFSFGMFVGEQKARFSYRWADRYHRDFGGPPFGMGRPRGFFGGHGAFGSVVKKERSKLVIKGTDNAERIVLITKNTSIVKGREQAEEKDIKEGSRVVVLGTPNNKGQIEARLIRIFDETQEKESMWRRDDLRLLPPSLL